MHITPRLLDRSIMKTCQILVHGVNHDTSFADGRRNPLYRAVPNVPNRENSW